MIDARRALYTLSLLLLAPAVATAMPGQSSSAFLAWAKSNTALHNMAQHTNEMSGQPYYSASFKVGGQDGTFSAEFVDGAIVDESIGIDTGNDDYDMSKHPKMLETLMTTVYGKPLTQDLISAKKVGMWTLKHETVPTALYRGQKFGYEVAHAFVRIIKLSEVDNEAKNLARCVKEECGD